MSKELFPCGFCGVDCDPKGTRDTGSLKFPDGSTKQVHLDHPGVRNEYKAQIMQETKEKKS